MYSTMYFAQNYSELAERGATRRGEERDVTSVAHSARLSASSARPSAAVQE